MYICIYIYICMLYILLAFSDPRVSFASVERPRFKLSADVPLHRKQKGGKVRVRT